MSQSHIQIPSSCQLRQDFLSFFKSKKHTIVPSSSLLPKAPNLLFTNAGMNPFVPIFLGHSACPYKPSRVANSQKCIRAGGKHNDLEDVGWDTYHHTFFEMLGNWSFGDYFKKEAIEWAWELMTEVWKFPKERLYATIYFPDSDDPTELDEEAFECWKEVMMRSGLDPNIHIVKGNKRDNFWAMGETGPCGPCSELHIDLTPKGDSKGRLVNQGYEDCIEIWNLVFIEFNSHPDGSLSNLPSRHVDTGMGLERLAGIFECTKGFTDFSKPISNYHTDLFEPIFRELEEMSGKKYASTLPLSKSNLSEQEQIDIAFRVISDHIRTLGFAISDGIFPGNTDRNYVLRRIIRRAVRYGRSLGFHKPFLHKMIDPLDEIMGKIFPEIHHQKDHVKSVLETEEFAFGRTLDRGIALFEDEISESKNILNGDFAFKLYDTYGFPFDLTKLMAQEHGMTIDEDRFHELMKGQKKRARAAQKKEGIDVSELDSSEKTRFCGFNYLSSKSEIRQLIKMKNGVGIVLNETPFYAEMGGQLGDKGTLQYDDYEWKINDTLKIGETFIHLIKGTSEGLEKGMNILAKVDEKRRLAIERHHTATHLFHWALREIVSPDATQKGSLVSPDKLTFDFNSKSLSSDQIRSIEERINQKILDNEPIHCFELSRNEVKKQKDVMQFFDDKYEDQVRVVQIGGEAGAWNGFSTELCGGTHRRTTGEIGSFVVISEAAVSAGIRRVEAVSGLIAFQKMRSESILLRRLGRLVNASQNELERKIEQLLEHQKQWEKERRRLQEKDAKTQAKALLLKSRNVPASRHHPPIPLIVENLGTIDGKAIGATATNLKESFEGVIVLGGAKGDSVALVAIVSKAFTPYVQAGKIIQFIAPSIGGKGGGRAEFARGGGKDPASLDKALAKVNELF